MGEKGAEKGTAPSLERGWTPEAELLDKMGASSSPLGIFWKKWLKDWHFPLPSVFERL